MCGFAAGLCVRGGVRPVSASVALRSLRLSERCLNCPEHQRDKPRFIQTPDLSASTYCFLQENCHLHEAFLETVFAFTPAVNAVIGSASPGDNEHKPEERRHLPNVASASLTRKSSARYSTSGYKTVAIISVRGFARAVGGNINARDELNREGT